MDNDINKINSYGAVCFSKEKGKLEVLLIHNSKGWSFPKGHIEEGETPLLAAKREVFEETGMITELTEDIFWEVPSVRRGENRTIRFFLGKACNYDEIRGSEEGAAAWFDIESAKQNIKVESDLLVLLSALEYEKFY